MQAVELVEAQGVDYFENLCLTHDNACQKDRSYQIPQFGVPTQKVAAHIKTQFYVDKELMVILQILLFIIIIIPFLLLLL